jgi:hypothetical protein
MPWECPGLVYDTNSGAFICRLAAPESKTNRITKPPRYADTCANCQIPGWKQEHPCRHLDLRPWITQVNQGNILLNYTKTCIARAEGLRSLDACDESCPEFEPPQPPEEKPPLGFRPG